MTDTSDNFNGTWHLCYWYPSNNTPGTEETSEYDVAIEQTGNQLIVQSLPNDIHAYILVKLVIDGIFAAGSWIENTSPEGEFGGMIYSGVVQLIVNDEQTAMTGLWAGVGRNHEKQQADVYSGKFAITRL